MSSHCYDLYSVLQDQEPRLLAAFASRVRALDPVTIAAIHGTVIDRQGAVVVGATVGQDGDPQTNAVRTDEDGRFLLPVEGGVATTLRIESDGFLPVRRQVRPTRREQLVVRPIVITKAAAAAASSLALPALHSTVIDLGIDNDTGRVAFVYCPEGLTAAQKTSAGLAALRELSLRRTDYPSATPADRFRTSDALPVEMPREVGPTYAVQLDALDADGNALMDVAFSEPLSLYIEDPAGFPVGSVVPVGSVIDGTDTWRAQRIGATNLRLGTRQQQSWRRGAS